METKEHGTLLLRLGCELAQGYGIARPMPADKIPAWVAAWKTYPEWYELTAAPSDDLPLLFASVEHRAWVRAIEEHLRGEREIPPPLDNHQCRLGIWLDTEGQMRHGAQPAYSAMEHLHRQVHLLVAKMCALQSQGLRQEATASLGELQGLRDALLRELKTLETGIGG